MADILLAERQRQTGGDADLLADDVDAGDLLADGVLDLHAGVHFHEIHLALGQQELHGAGVLVAHRLRRAYCQVADIGALLRGQLRAWGNLDELLVAPLDRTVTLEQVHHIAVAVGEDLRLDMFGVDDAFFQEHIGAAEGLGCLGNHPWPGLLQLGLRVAAADAAPAAAGGGLEHHRITDAGGFGQCLRQIGQIALGTRGDRHAGGDHAAPRLGLVSHAADHLGARADKADAALGADACQLGVLREKAVTRMQRIAAGFHRQIDQLARVQIAGQRVAADVVGLVGAFDV